MVGKETGIEFYDRDVGDILSCKLFYETTAAGTDLYVEKIAVQRYICCFGDKINGFKEPENGEGSL